jgi:hypothetical protein
LERAEELKQAKNLFLSPPEKKAEPVERIRADRPPPPGKFLMFGARSEIPWKPTPATHGMNGDAYIYHLAERPGGSDYRFENGRKEYRCAKCKEFFPLKSEAGGGKHITVDHVPPMSKRLDSGKHVAWFCDGENVWEGQRKEECIRDYNDPEHLQMMCNSENSRKGGLKGYDKYAPKIIATHDELCDSEESHSDVREVGLTES